MGGMLTLGCATRPAAAQTPSSEPPPRGTPSPRTSDVPMPPPGRVSETADENERRFPIGEGQLRKERRQRAQVPVTGRVEVRGADVNHACEGLSAEETIECPLHDPAAVMSISDVPKGARVTLRPGAAKPEKLQQLFACHKSLAVARPQAPTACAFFDAHSDAEVGVHGGRIEVDLERPTDVAGLRQQVRTALRRR
jgi:hypothetical protein